MAVEPTVDIREAKAIRRFSRSGDENGKRHDDAQEQAGPQDAASQGD